MKPIIKPAKPAPPPKPAVKPVSGNACQKLMDSYPDSTFAKLAEGIKNTAVPSACGQLSTRPSTSANMDAIVKTLGMGVLDPSGEVGTAMACIRKRLVESQGAFRGRYAHCDSDSASPNLNAPSLCDRSDGDLDVYSYFMALNLVYAARCLDRDWRWYFSLFAQESAFRMNVRSGPDLSPAGIGQFGKIGIEEVHAGLALGAVAESSKRGCELTSLRDPASRMEPDTRAGFCSRVAAPGNPMRSIRYSMALADAHSRAGEMELGGRSVQRAVQSWIFGSLGQSAQSEAIAREVIAIFEQHTHNTGMTGAPHMMRIALDRCSVPRDAQGLKVFYNCFAALCSSTSRDASIWGARQTGEHANYSTNVRKTLWNLKASPDCMPAFVPTPEMSQAGSY